MMRVLVISALLVTLVAASVRAAEKPDFLTDDEVEQLREAQDPSLRISTYLDFAQARLARFDDLRDRPAAPDYDVAGYLNLQLDQYIRITDALKDWIEDHFDRNDDMRAGLKKFVEVGSHQLDQLHHFQDSPDRYTPSYKRSLSDAIDDFSDALDGASKALDQQTKTFGELKREEKVDAQTAKEREKEEKKGEKGEEKLRKKEHEKGPPTDKDED